MHISTWHVARQYRPNIQTMLTSDNYLRDHHLKGPCKWPVSDRVPPPLYLWTWRRRRVNNISGGGELLGCQASTTMPFPRPRPALRLVNRGVRIIKNLIAHQSMEFDQRSTSADHSNMLSPVCSEATSECYPYRILTVQTCMIKC